MCEHGGFEAAAPVEKTGDSAEEGIPDQYKSDDRNRQTASQSGGHRQMPGAERDR